MGEVYLARDNRLQRDVAIKYLRGDLPAGDWQERLAREAQLLAQLNHPNIVQIYDLITSEGVPALVMEYIPGRNLHIHLREHRVESGEKLRWLSEIASGLAASHSEGIAHCDLKAENVLIDPRGVAKVTDFGIASSDTESGSDLKALGALAGQLLGDDLDLLSPRLKDLLRRLNHTRPSQRPDSQSAAEEFRHCWYEYTQDETPLPESLERQAAPRWRMALAGGAAVIIIAALATWILFPARQPNYVAVLPATVSGGESLSPRQSQLIQSTVQQALQDSVLKSEQLALVSFVQSSAADGTPSEQADMLGADTLVASTLDCRSATCELTLERLQGDAVSHHSTVSLLVDTYLESYQSVQRQWSRLFPAIETELNDGQAITDEQYLDYLELRLASDSSSLPAEEIVVGLEVLLESVERFPPLYQLYARQSIYLYEYMGDTKYLDRLESALEQAQDWASDSLFLKRSWFNLSLRRADYDRAAEILDSIEEQVNDDALLAFLKGDLHQEQYEHAKAEGYYARAVSLRPTMENFYSRARNLYFANEVQAADRVLDELLARYPHHTAALSLKALIAFETGAMDRAISIFQQSLEIQPDPLQRVNLGTAYMMNGDYEQARQQFLIAYQSGSRDSVLVLNLADAEQLLGNQEQARILYTDITKRQAEGDIAVDPIAAAQAHAQLGEFRAALSLLKSMETEWKGAPPYIFSSALIYSLAGQDLTAIVEVERALESGLPASWFDLPWFDTLCRQESFSLALANAGETDRCTEETE